MIAANSDAHEPLRSFAQGNTAAALGLGPPPPPGAGRIARRIGVGLIGTALSLLWLWSAAPSL